MAEKKSAKTRGDTTGRSKETSTGQMAGSSAIANVVQQVIQQMMPTMLQAAKAAATEVSLMTQKEMNRWKEVLEDRRKRDAENFRAEGNKKQYQHVADTSNW